MVNYIIIVRPRTREFVGQILNLPVGRRQRSIGSAWCTRAPERVPVDPGRGGRGANQKGQLECFKYALDVHGLWDWLTCEDAHRHGECPMRETRIPSCRSMHRYGCSQWKSIYSYEVHFECDDLTVKSVRGK